MKVAIVFESMFGNTAALAGDVMAGLTDAGADVTVTSVSFADREVLTACDLLVLAAPTHALTLSRPQTRAEAVTKGADPGGVSTGMRELLPILVATMSPASQRPAVAVFDTRVTKVRHLPGSAARGLARNLTRSGFDVVDHISFYVDDIPGPVASGEHAHARAWGCQLAESFTPVGHARR